MRKQILTDNETKTFLMKAFKCSRQAVWQALNFKRDSDQARRIRQLALKRGGKLTDGYMPKCETTHEEVEKTMTQTFGPRVKLVVDKETGVNYLIAKFGAGVGICPLINKDGKPIVTNWN